MFYRWPLLNHQLMLTLYRDEVTYLMTGRQASGPYSLAGWWTDLSSRTSHADYAHLQTSWAISMGPTPGNLWNS
jgi:hypothetical protein